ncbi:MAG: ATPase domain-containing protein, partial [Hungatella sp.]
MAKARTTAFFCKECGYESSKWMGQCPGCKEWNTLVEEPIGKKEPSGRRTLTSSAKPTLLSAISIEETDRITTGYVELDRVLGSGIVGGSLVLVGGDPGIGKSTLLLQVCRNLAAQGQRVLYISGEESLKQIKLRANRIGEITGEL